MPTHLFENAHNFSINNSQIVDNSQVINNHIGTSGLDILLSASIPEAAHDSSARYPPPRCHPGTREDYISNITQWSLDQDGRNNHVLWMKGPAGVGKSAVAQSCAEGLGDKLGAAFFFSRLNSRDDPDCFFTSIAYQLATKIVPYGDILDHKLRRNPTLVDKSIGQQFEELIAAPFREMKLRGLDLGELVIIVDGLDECDTEVAQRDIVEIVTASAQDRTTPLIWVFLSRPEAHIVSVFNSPHISSHSTHLELPVSRDIDNEIALYLTDELRKVQKAHELPQSWPSERDIWVLVDLSAGLFIYAATIVRFIEEVDSLGPEDQLHAVLDLAAQTKKVTSTYPLSELDLFYTLIMARVPPKTLLTTLKILYLTTLPNSLTNACKNANVLRLTEAQFRHACRSLHSVLKLDGPGALEDMRITYYHASFMDFLRDPSRSGKFCLNGACATSVHYDILERLNELHEYTRSLNLPQDELPPMTLSLTWEADLEPRALYICIVEAFFSICQTVTLEDKMLKALVDFDYAMVPFLWGPPPLFSARQLSWETFMKNVPTNYHKKLFQPLKGIGLHQKPRFAEHDRPYILGHGKNKAVWWRYGTGSVIGPYQRLRGGTIFKLFYRKLKAVLG